MASASPARWATQSDPNLGVTPDKGKGKRPANDESDGDHTATPTKTPHRKRSKKAPEAANLTDETAGLGDIDKYEQALPQLSKARDEKREKLQAAGKLRAYLAQHGVYVCDITISMQSNTIIAGYLNLHNTSQLNELNKALGPELRELKQLEKNNFEITGPRKPMTLALLFERLKRGSFQQQDVVAAGAPDNARYPRDRGENRSRAYLYLLRFVGAMFTKVQPLTATGVLPQVFTGPHDAQFSRRYIEGLDWEAEDIHRAIVYFYWWSNKTDKLAKDSKKVEDSTSGRGTYQNLPVLPNFYVPNQGMENSAEQDRRQARAYMTLMQGGGGTDATVEQLMQDFEAGATLAEAEAARNADGAVVHKIRLREDIDHLTPEHRRWLMQAMYADLEVMYQDPARQDKSFFGKVARAATAQELERDAEADTIVQQLAEDGGMGPKNIEVEKAKAKQRFLALQVEMNQCSATAPALDEARRELGLLIIEDLPEIDPVTNHNFSITYKGLSLKPWQPQGIAWLKRMLLSPIGAAILADDTGLGKTIQVYCTICELAAETQKQLLAWCRQKEECVAPYRTRWLAARPEGEAMPADDDIIAKEPDLLVHLQELGPRPQHRPVLVDGPPTSLGAWIGDQRRYFVTQTEPERNIHLKTFTSLGGDRASAEEREGALRTLTALKSFTESLDPNDPQTSRTVVLTTLQSFQKKVLQTSDMVKVDPERAPSTERPPEREGAAEPRDDEIEDEDLPDEPPVQDDEDMLVDDHVAHKGYTLRIPAATFSVRVIDEAHRIKSQASKQTIALYLLENCRTIMVTATPFKNSPKCFRGLLRFMFQRVRPLIRAMAAEPLNKAAYRSLRATFRDLHNSDILSLPKPAMLDYLRSLDPLQFQILIGSDGSRDDVEISSDIVPLPASISHLRRVKGSRLRVCGQDIILAAEIPPYKVITVELRMTALQRAGYRGILKNTEHIQMEHEITVEDDTEEIRGTDNTTLKKRRLTLGSFSPQLDQLAIRRIHSGAKTIERLVSGGLDSYTWWHTWTKNDLHVLAHSDRTSMARYITGLSVKLQFLTKMIVQHWIDRQEKLIIWCHEPQTIFLTELLLAIYELNHVAIHAGVKNAGRVKAELEFNTNPDTPIIVCSSRSAQESMNLQKGGHVQVLMDVVSATSTVQMIGRSHRIGQLHDVIAYRVTTDETYDQCLQALYFERFRATVAATTLIDDAHATALVQGLDHNTRAAMEQEISAQAEGMTQRDWAVQKLRGTYADAVQRELFGIRSDRDGRWEAYAQPALKNLEPAETIFRLGYGGNVADETAELYREKILRAEPQPQDGAEDKAALVDPDDEGFRPAPAPTGFVQLHMYRAPVPRVSTADAAMCITHAAKRLAKREAYLVNKITVAQILQDAQLWVPSPSPGLMLAAQKAVELEAEATRTARLLTDRDYDDVTFDISADEEAALLNLANLSDGAAKNTRSDSAFGQPFPVRPSPSAPPTPRPAASHAPRNGPAGGDHAPRDGAPPVDAWREIIHAYPHTDHVDAAYQTLFEDVLTQSRRADKEAHLVNQCEEAWYDDEAFMPDLERFSSKDCPEVVEWKAYKAEKGGKGKRGGKTGKPKAPRPGRRGRSADNDGEDGAPGGDVDSIASDLAVDRKNEGEEPMEE